MDTTPLNTSQMDPTSEIPSSPPPGGGCVQHYYGTPDRNNQLHGVVTRQRTPPVPTPASYRSHIHEDESGDENRNPIYPHRIMNRPPREPGHGNDPRYSGGNEDQSPPTLLSSPGRLQQVPRRHDETSPPSSGPQPTPTHHILPTEYDPHAGFASDPPMSNSIFLYPSDNDSYWFPAPGSGTWGPGYTPATELEDLVSTYDVSDCP